MRLNRGAGRYVAPEFGLFAFARGSRCNRGIEGERLCCSVFDEEKRSFEDWHKLYITAALTSVRLKESA